MKRAIFALVVIVAAGVAASLGTMAAVGVNPLSYLTPASSGCSVTVHSENAQDNAIQSAINAYPGGTICVGAGTFPEQLTISASGTTLKGAGDTKTIIEPTSGSGLGSLSFNTVDWDSAPYTGGVTCGVSTCVPLAAIILIESATPPPSASPTTGVTIEDLQVNGAAGSNNVVCGDDYVGVDFQDAAGTLSSAEVLNVASPPSAYGCQEVSGAIYAYNGYFYAEATGGTPASSPVVVSVTETTVAGYQKNGITCDDPSETCDVTSSTVTGAGQISDNAQNGIQVAYGALATLKSNKVSQNIYDGSTFTNNWYANGYTATGVLLYDSASGTQVISNTVSLDQMGIVYADDGSFDSGSASTSISQNTVDTSNGYGIVANGAPGGGDRVTISGNSIDNEASENPTSGVHGAPAILVDTGTFLIEDNTLKGSSTAPGGSNGANQTICGPDATSGSGAIPGTPYLFCSAYGNLTTAAIQGASESGNNQTNITLSGNAFSSDSIDLATLGVLGGAVNVVWV